MNQRPLRSFATRNCRLTDYLIGWHFRHGSRAWLRSIGTIPRRDTCRNRAVLFPKRSKRWCVFWAINSRFQRAGGDVYRRKSFQGLLTASSAASRVIQSSPYRGSRRQSRESYQVISGTIFQGEGTAQTVRQSGNCHLAVHKPHKDHLGTKRTNRQQRDHPVTRRFTRGSGTYRLRLRLRVSVFQR